LAGFLTCSIFETSFPLLHGTVVCVSLKDFCGAYSSESVQDLHLIPFSMPFPNGTGIAKICAKVIKILMYNKYAHIF
jgi:hypothetical protein